jgi:hypothetical protein
VDGWVGSIRILQEIGKGILSRSLRRMLRSRSGVERRAAPIPECVLWVSLVLRERGWAYENGLGHPQLRSLYISNEHTIDWETGRTSQQHPAVRSLQPVMPIQDRSSQSGKSLPDQLLFNSDMETRTIRFLNRMCREYWPLTFCICDNTRLGYVIS